MFNFLKKSVISQIETQFLNEQLIKSFETTYKKNRIPILIKNGAKNWALMSKWNKDYIADVSGDYICTIVKDARPAYASEKTTLRNYFHRFSSYSTLSLEILDNKTKPQFLKDIPLTNYLFREKEIMRYFFYHSNVHQGTLPHIHGDAFNILHSGKKRWIFYDADKLISPKGYQEVTECFKKFPPGSNISDFFNNYLNLLSKKNLNVMECIQEAGDIVYIPKNYSHAVINLDEVIGIVFETK